MKISKLNQVCKEVSIKRSKGYFLRLLTKYCYFHKILLVERWFLKSGKTHEKFGSRM